jgi:glycosyltransferase involved in cell wall biosynthesis/SAM-dependent methyltransferase
MNVPRVSVIVPVYNGATYLEEAIKCVLQQTFDDWELLLVDDGSTDGSVALAKHYANAYPDRIRYLEHPGHANHGQFATRVLGAQHARAGVVALLDQDDVWNVGYLKSHLAVWDSVQAQNVHLSYGPSYYWYPDETTGSKNFVQSMPIGTPKVFAPGELLEKYLSAGYSNTPNPCCALVRREVFDQIGHLAILAKGSPFEDQYLWWYIAVRWPVAIHANSWVHYRKHDTNCYERFTACPAQAAQTELTFLRTVRADLSRLCPDHGLLRNGRLADRMAYLKANLSSKRRLLPRLGRRALRVVRPLIRVAPAPVKRLGKGLLWPLKFAAARFRLAVGIEPLSYAWGSERGTPIFEYYIDQFLTEWAGDIRGHCLEFFNDQYKPTRWEPQLDHLEAIHLENSHPLATMVADLAGPNDIPSERFDCIICTHTLHSRIDVEKAAAELHRLLKPHGVLLVAVPVLCMYEPGLNESWRFTEAALEGLLATRFGPRNVTVRSYGNSLTAAGQLRGLTVENFTRAELYAHDARFAVEACARAVKAG